MLTSLFPLVYAAARYFPKLSGVFFLTVCSPWFSYYFLSIWNRQSYHYCWFFNFMAAPPWSWVSKQHRDNGDCSFTFLFLEAIKGQAWWERGQMCRQEPCTLGMAASPRPAFHLHVAINQLAGGCTASPVVVLGSEGWAGIQLCLKKAFLAMSDGQRNMKPTCCCCSCLKKLHYQPRKK